MKYFSISLLILSGQIAFCGDGPPTAIRYSNNEFGHQNVFEIGPGSTTGTAHYKWFGTEEVQNDLLRYEGSHAFTLPCGINVDCYLYRGFDIEGDEWWLAFDKGSSQPSGNSRIFFSFESDKDQPFEEWLPSNGHIRIEVSGASRLRTLLRAKSIDVDLLRSGKSSTAEQSFAVQLEWDAIRADLVEMSKNQEPIDLVWYTKDGRTGFGFPTTPYNRVVAGVLKLPPLPNLNQRLVPYTEQMTSVFTGKFNKQYWNLAGFKLDSIGQLVSNTLNDPPSDVRASIEKITSPRRKFVDILRKKKEEEAIEITPRPMQFSAGAFVAHRYYWQTRVILQGVGPKRLRVSVETSFGTRNRTQTVGQVVWKHRTTHSAQLTDSPHPTEYSVRKYALVHLNEGPGDGSTVIVPPGNGIAKRFDEFEGLLLGTIKRLLTEN